MASITIRNLDEFLKSRLRIRAAHRHRSMEEEVRHILKTVLNDEPAPAKNLAAAIQKRLRPLGGVNLEIPPREPVRSPPKIGREFSSIPTWWPS